MASCIQVLCAFIVLTLSAALSKKSVQLVTDNSKVVLQSPQNISAQIAVQLATDTSKVELQSPQSISAQLVDNVRLKRSASHHYNKHLHNISLSCQLELPRGNQVQIARQIEKWINVFSLLDYSSLTVCQQVTTFYCTH